jgi:hypothetical protein
VLAARLSSLDERQKLGPGHPIPVETLDVVLGALGRVGGPNEVPAVVALLRPSSLVRFAAFTTLASIATPEAVAAMDAALPARRPDTPWFEPASPEWLSHQRMVKGDLDAALRAGGAARAPSAPGTSLLVFPESWNVDDLWAARIDESGHVLGPATFLGVQPPGKYGAGGRPITVRLDGTRLEIRRTDGDPGVTRVDLEKAARDTDKDGLPDLVERRFLLDPGRADTDGDGLADGVDPVPTKPSSPLDDISAPEAAFFEQYGLGHAGIREPAIIVADRALPAYGPYYVPALVLTRKERNRADEKAKRAGFSLPVRLSLERWEEVPPQWMGILALRPAAGGRERAGFEERAFYFSWETNQAGESYAVVMRKIGARWYIRAFVHAMHAGAG